MFAILKQLAEKDEEITGGGVLEVLQDGRAVVYWFTYDEEGRQRWFVATGHSESDRLVFDTLLRPNGARFGERFDSADVAYPEAGELSIRGATASLHPRNTPSMALTAVRR